MHKACTLLSSLLPSLPPPPSPPSTPPRSLPPRSLPPPSPPPLSPPLLSPLPCTSAHDSRWSAAWMHRLRWQRRLISKNRADVLQERLTCLSTRSDAWLRLAARKQCSRGAQCEQRRSCNHPCSETDEREDVQEEEGHRRSGHRDE
eukprot:4909590-Prymnesium_polylepis.1